MQSLDNPAVVAALNRQAAILQNVFFPASVLGSLALGDKASVTAVRLFLARFREEAGAPQDAVEKLLLDQLIVAHLKVGELYALAAEARELDFKAMYGNAATRLLGTICQLISTLTSYRSSTLALGERRKAASQRRRTPPSSPQTEAVEENRHNELASNNPGDS